MADRSKLCCIPYSSTLAVEGECIVLTVARYIRSTIPLDALERRARFPIVDSNGYESKAVNVTRS